MKKALITGVTGQDGAYLAEFLLKKGYEVHGLKRRSSSFNTSRIDHLYQDPHESDAKFFLHYGDLIDSTNIIKLIEKIQPDEIYNLGAQSHVAVSFETPEYTANCDAIGVLRILEAVKNSDKDAFHQLFSNFYDTLFRFVVYKVKDSDLAEDISQETFLRVWKKRTDLAPEKSFFSLIARISTNLCYDYFRHSAVRKRHEDQIPEYGKSHFDNPEKMNQAKMLEEEIQRIVNEKLPDKCKSIFILSRIESRTNQEIAEMLGLSIRTVENQIYRALKILKKNLENYL